MNRKVKIVHCYKNDKNSRFNELLENLSKIQKKTVYNQKFVNSILDEEV